MNAAIYIGSAGLIASLIVFGVLWAFGDFILSALGAIPVFGIVLFMVVAFIGGVFLLVIGGLYEFITNR